MVEGWRRRSLNSHQAVFALLYLGVLPTGAAQVMLVVINREAGPVFFSLVNYQVPIWSVIFGAVFLLEPLPPSLLLGLALILSGVALSQLGAPESAVSEPLDPGCGTPQGEGLSGFCHVMHTQHLHALRHAGQRHGYGAMNARVGLVHTAELSDEALA